MTGVVVLIATAGLFWLTVSVHSRTERRLLDQQVAQAGAALANQVPTVQAQMTDAVEVAVNTRANPSVFKRFASPKLSLSGPFASMSLWHVGHGAPREVVAVGLPQALVADHLARHFFSQVHPSKAMFLTGLFPGTPKRLGYAEMPPGDTAGLVVYAERYVPGTRRVPTVASYYGSYAVYLGRRQDRSALLEATEPLPLKGETASVPIPFGDKVMTLVEARSTGLAGGLAASVPWIVLGAGTLVAASGGSVVEYVTRRRGVAERQARENRRRYQQQRAIAAELQDALLPTVPPVDGLDVAARYFAGVAGTEVGGDWYDVVPRSDKRCVMVVGDVSGRGLRAASTMASLRFPLRAYLLAGQPIETAIANVAPLLDIGNDEHFATVLVAELDIAARRMTVVSAGHLLPLVVTDAGAYFVSGRVDVPIGVSATIRPTPMSVEVPDTAKVVLFSDGLVERSGETLDVGLERLRVLAAQHQGSIAELVDGIASALVSEQAHDDTVVLGAQWAT